MGKNLKTFGRDVARKIRQFDISKVGFVRRQNQRNFLLIANLALDEMHRLDEACGAPIDFNRKKLYGGWSGLAEMARETPRTIGNVGKFFFNMGRAAANGARKLANKLARPFIKRNLFALKPLLEMEHAAPVDIQKEISRLSPREAFEIGLLRIKEQNCWPAMNMMMLGVTTDLGLLGYYQQFQHLDVVSGATSPAIVTFNLLAGVGASMLIDRFHAINQVRAFRTKHGEARLRDEVASLRQQLGKDKPVLSIAERVTRWRSGHNHD